MGKSDQFLEAEDDGFWPTEGLICDQHFRDQQLLATVGVNISEVSCDFCDRTGTVGVPHRTQRHEPSFLVGIKRRRARDVCLSGFNPAQRPEFGASLLNVGGLTRTAADSG